MKIQISNIIFEEINNLFKAIMTGAVFSLIYDTVRIFRRIIKKGKVATSFEDIVYWLIMSVWLFIFTYKVNGGVIRGYIVAGIAVGMLLFEISIGRLYVKYVSVFIGRIILILQKINRKLFQILKKVVKFLCLPLKKIMKPIKIKITDKLVDRHKRISEKKHLREVNREKNSKRGAVLEKTEDFKPVKHKKIKKS